MLLETLVSVHKTVGFAVQQDRTFRIYHPAKPHFQSDYFLIRENLLYLHCMKIYKKY
jgi:hypothetical protein